MVWFLRGICKQCISRLYVYVIFKLSNPHLSFLQTIQKAQGKHHVEGTSAAQRGLVPGA